MKPIYDFKEKTPQLDKAFAEYLDGKSVAIVGRNGIHDMKQGEFIDSHDVVVRMSHVIPYCPDYSMKKVRNERDPVKSGEFIPRCWRPIIGSIVNIMYPHGVRTNDGIYLQRWIELFQEAGGMFLCDDQVTAADKLEDGYIKQYAPVRYVSWELRYNLVRAIDKMTNGKAIGAPLRGTVICADIARHNVTSIYITGLTCFYATHLSEQKRLHPSCYGDLKYLSEFVKHDKVTCDAVMASLFKEYCDNR